uniref:Putative secreted protein n=1 Tax=Anopheles darlingi TaxID=43151 RepID=A0A2M4DC34_ANODA
MVVLGPWKRFPIMVTTATHRMALVWAVVVAFAMATEPIQDPRKAIIALDRCQALNRTTTRPPRPSIARNEVHTPTTVTAMQAAPRYHGRQLPALLMGATIPTTITPRIVSRRLRRRFPGIR